MERLTAMSDRLYRLTHKRTGEVAVLRHVGTTMGDEGERVYWLCLPDDPMQCLMSMSEAQIREYTGIKLVYWGQCADSQGQVKHWFSVPDDSLG